MHPLIFRAKNETERAFNHLVSAADLRKVPPHKVREMVGAHMLTRVDYFMSQAKEKHEVLGPTKSSAADFSRSKA